MTFRGCRQALTCLVDQFRNWLCSTFSHKLVHMAIVRRYVDANGHYVGELYIYDIFGSVAAYRMIGCSLDSFPIELQSLSLGDEPGALDTMHDFLAPMGANTLRVGATEPTDNDRIRKMVSRLPRRNIRLVIQNKFIEYVLERKNI